MDRTSSMGLWTYAKNYLDAGYTISTSVTQSLAPIPAYYLYCHAIELGLKAYLRGTGSSIEDLKDLGHNLSKAYKKALSIGLGGIYKLSPEEFEAMELANQIYKKKEFEYITAGFKKLPNIKVLQAAAGSLIYAIEKYCKDKRNVHS